MARPLRIVWEGAWYHVTARGNERGVIFRQDEDRKQFLSKLARMVERFRTRLHEYTLMDNHYHLILETPEANLSAAMQWLNGGYSSWFNRRHRRHGHLLEGRFKAIVVDPQRWGLELSRYVHLNPVRVRAYGLDKQSQRRYRVGAGREQRREEWKERVNYLRNYPWSSYRAYIGLEPAPQWLQCETVLKWVGGKGADRRRAYRRYVEEALREGLEQTPWAQLEAQVVLGDAAFVEQAREHARGNGREQTGWRLLRKRPSLAKVIAGVERSKGERWESFSGRYGDWGRDMVLCLAYEHCGMTLKGLGDALGGLDYVSVCGAIRRFRNRLEHDRSLSRVFAELNAKLKNEKT